MQVFEPSEFVLSILTQICISTFRKGLVCFLPVSVRFWLDNFLFAGAAVDAAGQIYFARVAIRMFSKLPPSESKSLIMSHILSVLVNIFCEVFSALELGSRFFTLLVAHKT
jgi:hypothetical protein